jgi:hypothetical protein
MLSTRCNIVQRVATFARRALLAWGTVADALAAVVARAKLDPTVAAHTACCMCCNIRRSCCNAVQHTSVDPSAELAAVVARAQLDPAVAARFRCSGRGAPAQCMAHAYKRWGVVGEARMRMEGTGTTDAPCHSSALVQVLPNSSLLHLELGQCALPAQTIQVPSPRPPARPPAVSTPVPPLPPARPPARPSPRTPEALASRA